MPVVADTFADGPAGNTPITAAKLNNIESAIVADDATNSSSASAQAISKAYTAKVDSSVSGATGLQTQGQAGRFAGVTAGGPPTVGTYLTADWVVDQSGQQWICLGGGTPGTWICPGTDEFAPTTLTWGNGRPNDVRSLPGTWGSAAALVADRLYLMAFPVPVGRTIASINVHVTTIGQTGAVIRAGVYKDDFGWPNELIADLGTQPADVAGWITFTPSTPIAGSRFVWVAIAAQLSSTTAPSTSQFTDSPYRPVVAATGPDAQTFPAAYANSVSGALPSVFSPAGRGADLSNVSPYFNVRFGIAPAPTIYVPDRVPVLVPTEAWEQGALQEPSVYTDGTQWYMIYSGGWSTEGLGWATAPTIDGPWTKQGKLLSNGVWIGSGRSAILYEGSVLYVYYNNGTDLSVCSGASPASLGASTTAFTASGTVAQIQNTSVINDGGTYKMMFEGKDGSGSLWVMGYATATAAIGPYTTNTFPLPTLQMNGGSASGPWLTKNGSTYSLWYHASILNGANLPNDIFHATSTDLINWTPELIPKVRRTHRFEVDQAADPFVVTDPGSNVSYLFWDAVDNTSSAGYIMRSVPQAMTITP